MEEQRGRPGRHSFTFTSAMGSSRFSARWLGPGGGLSPAGTRWGHRQWVERLAVTWQGLLPDSPLAVPACSSASFSFSLSRGASGWGFSSSFSRTSEREPGRPPVLAVHRGLRRLLFAPPSGEGTPDPLMLAISAQARPPAPPLGVSDVALAT